MVDNRVNGAAMALLCRVRSEPGTPKTVRTTDGQKANEKPSRGPAAARGGFGPMDLHKEFFIPPGPELELTVQSIRGFDPGSRSWRAKQTSLAIGSRGEQVRRSSHSSDTVRLLRGDPHPTQVCATRQGLDR